MAALTHSHMLMLSLSLSVSYSLACGASISHSQLLKKYESRAIEHVDWLDRLAFIKMEHVKQSIQRSRVGELFLHIEAPSFEFPVVFHEVRPPRARQPRREPDTDQVDSRCSCYRRRLLQQSVRRWPTLAAASRHRVRRPDATVRRSRRRHPRTSRRAMTTSCRLIMARHTRSLRSRTAK